MRNKLVYSYSGRESEWTPGVGDGQGGLECCNSWSRKESDTTERLNRTELNWFLQHKKKFIVLGFYELLERIFCILQVVESPLSWNVYEHKHTVDIMFCSSLEDVLEFTHFASTNQFSPWSTKVFDHVKTITIWLSIFPLKYMGVLLFWGHWEKNMEFMNNQLL